MRRLTFSLSRSLANEGISEDLYDTLEEVLGGQTQSAPTGRVHWTDDLLVRFGLPQPLRPRWSGTASPPPEEAARISDRFRRATTQLLQVAPHRVAMYPTDELLRLIALRDERPEADHAVVHLRRFAVAILAILDLMGDDAS